MFIMIQDSCILMCVYYSIINAIFFQGNNWDENAFFLKEFVPGRSETVKTKNPSQNKACQFLIGPNSQVL